MAQPIPDEELQLRRRARRRLIGAVVLVMVVVLVLPMVLDTEPKPASQDIDIRIPSPDASAFKSKIVPVAPGPDAQLPARSPEGTAARPDAVTKEAPGSSATPGAGDAALAKSDPGARVQEPAKEGSAASKEAPVKPEAQQAAAVAHVVQVTALLNADRAREIHERIRAGGIKAYTEIVTTASGDVTRVRAGPFPTIEAAEQARSQIQRMEFDGRMLDGKVIPVK